MVDFISAKWKTTRATRRAGYLHITVSVLPMLLVIAYAAAYSAREYAQVIFIFLRMFVLVLIFFTK